MKISINITTWNRKKMTEFCINSLIETTNRKQFKLIVVDNFSTDGTVDMLKKMKNENIIDKLILNSKNLHLGKAVNQAWDSTDKDTEWVLWCNNDFFFMDNWLDNFTLVVNDLNVDFINCLNLEGNSRNKIAPGIPKKTKKGGSYLKPVLRKNKIFETGAAPALKKSLVDKYNIRVSEKPFMKGYTGPSTPFYKRLHNLKLKGVRLDKPCLLLQFGEYNNPLYKKYYNNTFKTRGMEKVLKYFKKYENATNLAKYYEGTNYLDRIRNLEKNQRR